jgi:flavodoxin
VRYLKKIEELLGRCRCNHESCNCVLLPPSREYKKLLDAIKELGDIELINVLECKEADLSGYDVIGFASGIYFGKFAKEIREFAKSNLPSQKRVFLIYTYGVKSNGYTKMMERIIAEKSCRLIGAYGCRGFDEFGPLKLFGGVAKGHPDENDVNGAIEFFKGLLINEK